jgi:RNA polymerase sigma factor (sigma-70 family)
VIPRVEAEARVSDIEEVTENKYEDEGLLFERARAGDVAAWMELVERCTPLLWRVARSFRFDESTTADIVQATWLALAEHGDRVRNTHAVRAWLASTARRASLHEVRRRQRVLLREDDATVDGVDPEPGPSEQVSDADRDARLWRAAERLPVRDRQLLSLLTATPALSYAEIAGVMGVPVGSIGPTRSRCLARLRRELAIEGITAFEE